MNYLVIKFNLTIFILTCLIFLYPRPVSAQTHSYVDEFNLNWSFKKIFGTSNIPLPSSAPSTATIHAVYSPSVIKIDNTYFMFFGVSILCSGVYRDSTALASSTNGFDWNFVKYIIEPDAVACTKPVSQWSSSPPFTFQVNDPSAYIDPSDPNTILVFYTTVRSNQDNFGHIGLAKFNRQLVQLSRNDLFLPGTTAINTGGYSRPTVDWLDYTGPRLYFDSIAKIGSVALTNLSGLTGAAVRDESLIGIDIDIPNLGSGDYLLLSGGLTARSKRYNGLWSSTWPFNPLSGQGWDINGQGSPWLFMDETMCKARLYMSGTVLNPTNPTVYDTLNIGMAWPSDDRVFNYDVCKVCNVPNKPVHAHPINGAIVRTGQPLVLRWNLSDYGNRPLKQYLCISSNQTSCDLVWQVLPPEISSYTFIPPTNDTFVTWNVQAINSCMKSNTSVAGSFTVSDVVVAVPGDVNGDGNVNMTDYNTLVSNFGQSGTNINRALGDLNGNQRVDIFDHNEVVTNFSIR